MSITLGLDERYYLVNKNCHKDDLDIISAELLDIFLKGKEEGTKFLYNENFQLYDDQNFLNILTEESDYFSYIQFGLGGYIEYVEETYAFEEELVNNSLPYGDEFNTIVLSTYFHLNEEHRHNIVYGKEDKTITLHNNTFYFRTDPYDRDNNTDLLPNIQGEDDLNFFFQFYHWYFGRNLDNIVLSNNFLQQVLKNGNNLKTITSSMFRGIYYPDYKTANGAKESTLTIGTHSDKNASCYINQNNCTLFRIHCVSIEKRKGGLLRICYTYYQNKYIVFYYHKKHCETLKHSETLSDREINRFIKREKDKVGSGTEIALSSSSNMQKKRKT